jgi:hypothetical protein
MEAFEVLADVKLETGGWSGSSYWWRDGGGGGGYDGAWDRAFWLGVLLRDLIVNVAVSAFCAQLQVRADVQGGCRRRCLVAGRWVQVVTAVTQQIGPTLPIANGEWWRGCTRSVQIGSNRNSAGSRSGLRLQRSKSPAVEGCGAPISTFGYPRR